MAGAILACFSTLGPPMVGTRGELLAGVPVREAARVSLCAFAFPASRARLPFALVVVPPEGFSPGPEPPSPSSRCMVRPVRPNLSPRVLTNLPGLGCQARTFAVSGT